jgi:hypothetical protein
MTQAEKELLKRQMETAMAVLERVIRALADESVPEEERVTFAKYKLSFLAEYLKNGGAAQ